MNICFRPSPIREIQLNECIGNSLPTLNTNFKLLEQTSCLIDNRLSSSNINYTFLNTKTIALFSLESQLMWASITMSPELTSFTSNISNFTQQSTGRYRINFTNPVSSSLVYSVFGTAYSTNSSINLFVTTASYWTDAVDIIIRDNNYQNRNPDFISISIYN